MSRADRQRGTPGRSTMNLDQAAEILCENQKLITLGRLAASIAHEINNPLESITNLLYLMEQCEPKEASEYLRLAQRELSRVVQISKQTLTFSRETLAPASIQLAELIEEVLGLHARKIGDKSLRVVRQYETCEAITVFAGEMRQVLSNLISNAIETSSERGRIIIRIRAARNWRGRELRGLRLSVGDNGSGIPDDVRDRLGEPFFTTKGQSGTGLGLWVTQSILSRYGASLQMRSSVAPMRHGTVFSLSLPFNVGVFTLLPGGGDAETFPAREASDSRGRGLRLVSQEGDATVGTPDDAPAEYAPGEGSPKHTRAQAGG